MTQLTPQQEDPVVHAFLANLEQFSPRPGFADRVMSQVWQPSPSWVQRVKHACHTTMSRKGAWAVVGGLAGTSAVTTVAIIIAAITYRVQFGTGLSAMTDMAVGFWRFSVSATAQLAVVVMRWLEPLALDQTMLVAVALSTIVVLTLSWLGLQHTIRQYRNERTALHARA